MESNPDSQEATVQSSSSGHGEQSFDVSGPMVMVSLGSPNVKWDQLDIQDQRKA